MKKVISVLFVLISVFFSLPLHSSAASPEIKAKSAVVIDAKTNFIYYTKAENEKVHPSVAVKTMTALVALNEVKDLDTVVTIADNIYNDVKLISAAKLKKGEQMKLKDLLGCLLVSSSNEAANAISEFICPGDRKAFVEKMNALAKQYGAVNTKFTNCFGGESSGSYSTAMDIAKICLEASKNDTFMTISSSNVYRIDATNLSPNRILYTTNMVIESSSKYFIRNTRPIRNHNTTESGYSLATYQAQKGIVCVVIGSTLEKVDGVNTNNSYIDTKNLLSWATTAFKSQQLVKQNQIMGTMEVELGKKYDTLTLVAKDNLNCVLLTDYDKDLLTVEKLYPESVVAPVEKNTVMGKLDYYYDGVFIGSVDLVAQYKVNLDMMLYYRKQINDFFSNPLVIATCVCVSLLFISYITIAIVYNRKKRQAKKYKGRY